MAKGTANRCRGWDNEACQGTPYCPPRCPRYFDATGAPVTVRPARLADRSDLLRMYDGVGAEQRTMGVPPVVRSERRRWVETLLSEGWNLVAVVDDRVVGHVAVAPTPAEDPEFLLFVHEEYQERGIGTELLRQVVAYAAAGRYEALRLDVSSENVSAKRLYERIGFEEERAAEAMPTAVEMRLRLGEPLTDEVQRPPAER